MSAKFPDNLPDRLRRRLAEELPSRAAQSRFAPRLTYGRHHDPPPFDARDAAVMALIYPHDGRWWLPLTLRPPHMKSHADQVSFPGGLTEADESSEQSAVREFEEELGVWPAGAEVLGKLSPLYVFASNFVVTPFVAAVSARPDFRANAAEVAEIVELPLDVLLQPASRTVDRIHRRAMSFQAPCIQHGSCRIWGATAMIMGELIAVLEDVRTP